MERKIALITGATSGIGRSTAFLLAENGYELIITGRRAERLAELSLQLHESFGRKTLTLNFDVRNRSEVAVAIASLPEEWKAIEVLVNNAGLALGLSDIQSGDMDDWDTMIDTNVKGLLYITRNVSPLMIAHGHGHIINIGSVAGKEVYPNGNVYCATKHAVDALNKAMRIDMLSKNIKVTGINPGMLETEFSIVRFHGDEERAKKVYEGITPLHPDDVADAIWYVLSRPPHVCINDLVLTPTAQATARDVIRK